MEKIPLNTVGILKDYEIEHYLDDQLATQTKYCRKLTKDQIMSWQSNEISNPLLKILNSTFHQTAVAMFNRTILN